MKAIITVGVSASGKTTFANEWMKEAGTHRHIICRDDIRATLVELEHGPGNFTWGRWKWKRENEVSAMVDTSIAIAAMEKFDICIADTNLNLVHLKHLRQKLNNLGYIIELKYFDVTYEEAIKRDVARKNPVGALVIGKQFADLRKHFSPYEGGDNLPIAVICDIDGTLAHMNGKRGPFEWDKVELDDVDKEVKLIVDNLYLEVDFLILLSGRDGVAYNSTVNWLQGKGVRYDKLWMRNAEDMRSDVIVKRELFESHIAGKYNIRLVLDDRPKVCRMWRDLGLKVLQCGDPHVEF